MHHSLLATLNLFALLLPLAALAGVIAQKQWRGNGNAAAVFLIVLCGQIWLIPQAISFFVLHSAELLYPLWFGNWLASAVAIIVFTLTFRGTSSHLLDAARMDGGGIYRHVVWPTARPALGALAVILFMATWMEFLRPLLPTREGVAPAWTVTVNDLTLVGAASFLATLPLVAIFFARRCFLAKLAAD